MVLSAFCLHLLKLCYGIDTPNTYILVWYSHFNKKVAGLNKLKQFKTQVLIFFLFFINLTLFIILLTQYITLASKSQIVCDDCPDNY